MRVALYGGLSRQTQNSHKPPVLGPGSAASPFDSDIIVTGTPAGAGARFDPPKGLVAGDRVEVEVPGAGLLANTVVDEQV